MSHEHYGYISDELDDRVYRQIDDISRDLAGRSPEPDVAAKITSIELSDLREATDAFVLEWQTMLADLQRRFDQLHPVYRALNLWLSDDWGEDQFREALDDWRKRASTPPA